MGDLGGHPYGIRVFKEKRQFFRKEGGYMMLVVKQENCSWESACKCPDLMA